ncbi:hypothetical protein F4827_007125 [Paraburkholderia bannensis]|uniref:Uncharacterized protein n=1 Tax=Paraburkholderia bannensis TaxID=765414 RepID=A0A7W9U588_9BURK|nr:MULTISPECIES: hypothetical protein [Paraburkholderia]MBB3262222.1 hypothetical protein [Paraburkholderia sp. WP4_3_2]MBB6107242.1 hypothetical protein [Paraburkholderia bannensis]
MTKPQQLLWGTEVSSLKDLYIEHVSVSDVELKLLLQITAPAEEITHSYAHVFDLMDALQACLGRGGNTKSSATKPARLRLPRSKR